MKYGLEFRDSLFHSYSRTNLNFILAEYVDLTTIKSELTKMLTTWTEWSSCSPYCKRSRERVCYGEFQCFDDDGDSKTLCTGTG